MNIPGFTGKSSLYKTSLHYKPARQAINQSSQISMGVNAAAIWVGNNEGKSVNCDTCVGGECVGLGCTGKWGEIDRLIKGLINRVVDGGVGGGGGAPVDAGTCAWFDFGKVCFQRDLFTRCCTTTAERKCMINGSWITTYKSSDTRCESTVFADLSSDAAILF